MNINTIVLDLDGTLLNSKKEISPKTKAALLKAQQAGIKLILASGRPTPAMTQIAKQLEMDKHHGFLISFNGASVIDCEDNTVLFDQHIDRDTAKALFRHLENFDVIPMISNKNYLYVNDVYNNEINPRSHIENDGSTMNIIQYESRPAHYSLREMTSFAEEVDFDLHKILVAADPVYLLENHKAIDEPFRDHLSCVFSAPFFYEFTDKGVDKGNTMNRVLGPLGIKPENVMALGDGHNDKTLIQYAGLGIAMGNAEDEVKAIAKDVTASNDEDGIAKAIMKYIPQLNLL